MPQDLRMHTDLFAQNALQRVDDGRRSPTEKPDASRLHFVTQETVIIPTVLVHS